MRRLYADLHLCPNPQDSRQASNLVRKAAELGYSLVAIAFTPEHTPTFQIVQKECSEVNVDLVTRIDLKPRSPSELMRCLRRFRRRFEIIAVLCEAKNVSRQAAKDRRVDLLNFPSIDYRRRFFDFAEAELTSGSLASLEIDMKPIFDLKGPPRIKLMSTLRREAALAKDFDIPIVISSGVSNDLHVRKPMELASLTSLFDLKRDFALDAVSKNPMAIVVRNRGKLDSRFVAPGIRVVRRGRDC